MSLETPTSRHPGSALSAPRSSSIPWKNQALLALLLAGLGGLLFWYEGSHKPKKEKQEELSKKVATLEDKALQEVSYVFEGRQFTFQCAEKAPQTCKTSETPTWNVLASVSGHATTLTGDKSTINQLVAALNALQGDETINLKNEPADKKAALLKEYGFSEEARKDPQQAQIQIKTSDGSLGIYLGVEHPVEPKIFVATSQNGTFDDSRVFILDKGFRSNFQKDLSYWRDKTLVTVSPNEINKFEYSAKTGSFTGSKVDGHWTLQSQGQEFPGDPETIDNLISTITSLKAQEFVAEKKEDPAALKAKQGANPFLKLSLYYTVNASPPPAEKEKKVDLKSEKITFDFFEKTLPPTQTGPLPKNPKNSAEKYAGRSPVDKLYASLSTLSPFYEISAGSKDRLKKTVKDVRLAKLMTSLERYSAKKLQFKGKSLGETPLVYSYEDSKWKEDQKSADVTDSDKIQKLLDKLSGNRIQEFLNDSKITRDEAHGLELSLLESDGKEKRKYFFWQKSGKLYAKDLLSGRKETYQLDSTLIEGLPWKRDHFVKAALAPPQDPLKGLENQPGAPPAPDTH